MNRIKFKDISQNKYFIYSVITILAYLNNIAFRYAKSLGDTTYTYLGTRFWGYNPTSLLYFAACWFVLYKSYNEKAWKDSGRVILSSVLGVFISITYIWGNMIFIGAARIFDSTPKVIGSIWGILGLSIFYVPMFSVLCGLFNSFGDRYLKQSTINEVNKVSTKQLLVYFFVTWGIFFITYIPLFLYWYPGNFVYDAGDQVFYYMSNRVSTHHTIAHTRLLGKFYEFGYNRGNVDIGIALFSLLQMALLSFSIAFFLTECRKRIKVRPVRVILYVLFLANISLPYFAISTIKGVYTAAFTLIAVTFLWKISECTKWNVKVILAFCFSICMIIASLFRNNVIYACLAAGIIIVLIQKDLRHRILFILAFVLILGGNRAYTKISMNVWNIQETDSERESQSVPLMFLARVQYIHGSVLSEKEWEEILRYIPNIEQTGYSPFISDSVKGGANEEMLRNNKVNYYKFIVKMALKYPGDLVESVAALTLAYWYPGDYPYFMLGSPAMYQKAIGGGYPEIEIKNLLPFGSKFFDDYFYKGYGRFEIPLLGWFWRTTTYVWSFVFGFAYLIYQKRWKQLGFVAIPFMYLLTCFLGPVAWMRYIVINIVTLPVMIWCMIEKEK